MEHFPLVSLASLPWLRASVPFQCYTPNKYQSISPHSHVVLATNIAVIACCSAAQAEDNWYEQSFYLLHEDHHTSDAHEVGRDADPAETARLVNLSRPDVIQIHAKGNPGWTTYPSEIGHVPTRLRHDVMAHVYEFGSKE